jgi:hypothetical protein
VVRILPERSEFFGIELFSYDLPKLIGDMIDGLVLNALGNLNQQSSDNATGIRIEGSAPTIRLPIVAVVSSVRRLKDS